MLIQNNNTMLVPLAWQGYNSNVVGEMHWLNELPNNTWCSLWRNWSQEDNLPMGYDLYVVSYHLEAVDVDWVLRQCQLTSAPIILLSDVNYYDFPAPQNLHCFRYILWHRQLEKAQQWFPVQQPKHLKYKASSVCNRITQSKIITFTTIAETLGNDSLQILGTWLDNKNVHNRDSTGNILLDRISDIFWGKYFGNEIRIDNFDNSKNNHQLYTGNPWTPIYQESALHFTNESFHYSLMETAHGKFIYPGPFLTEKTLKCLLGATGFIPVGQFDTYQTLSNLGFKFDYDLDCSFDSDPGNLTRLEKVVKLILNLASMSIDDIFLATRDSSLYNQEHILSGKFSNCCEMVNLATKNSILETFGR